MVKIEHLIPWEPTISFIFRGYKLIYWGFKSPSFFVVLGSKGMTYMITNMCSTENLFGSFLGGLTHRTFFGVFLPALLVFLPGLLVFLPGLLVFLPGLHVAIQSGPRAQSLKFGAVNNSTYRR